MSLEVLLPRIHLLLFHHLRPHPHYTHQHHYIICSLWSLCINNKRRSQSLQALPLIKYFNPDLHLSTTTLHISSFPVQHQKSPTFCCLILVCRCRILMRNGLIIWLSYKQLRKYQTSNVNLKNRVVLFQRRCSKPQMCKENNNCVDGYEWFVPAYQFQKQFKEDIIIQFIENGR